ncbi:MarR family winged helix-turn-helix transcriptional regulator [Thermoflavimicrobium dichotomicum]|uniref:DNA-binding transcriptional regulator, MarR family n=1 Tax=Thermoflavimicrobium dichotomicum TaxID=46223 RepID=A0A1I3V8K0_9BACL|nr:MarR family transcriptional regulator [Thermoflavimicrobium dichotomicum]SFJ90547.1 DNA-binding transcriptional regulator, MarR family [Thermoflavimicrobium dichotomicum]
MKDKTKLDPQLQRIESINERIERYLSKQLEDGEPQYKLTPSKFVLLRTLLLKGKCMVANLAHEANLTSGATTLALNRLENDGLIIRTRDQMDRRIVWVELTEEGKSLVEKILYQRQKFFRQMLSVLTDEEQETFIYLLEKISLKLSNPND